MKKLLNISVIAALAVLPVAANAARTVTAGNDATGGSTTALATTSYVQGAYNAANSQINALISDTAVAAKANNEQYKAIAAGDSVSENLVALDNAIATLESNTGSTVGALSGLDSSFGTEENAPKNVVEALNSLDGRVDTVESGVSTLQGQMGNTALDNNDGLSATTVTEAINELQDDKQEKSDSTVANGTYAHITQGNGVGANLVSLNNAVVANDTAINTLNGDDTTTGSVAKQIKDAISTVNGNAGDLNSLTTTQKGSLVAAINELDSDKQEKSDSTVAAGTYDHIQAGTAVASNLIALDTAVDTIENKQIPIVSNWSTNAVTNTKISDLATAQ